MAAMSDGEEERSSSSSYDGLLPGFTLAHRRDAQAAFWGLGVDKWKECIDVHHWPAGGRFTYDLCLHNGNGFKREYGYLASIHAAWCVAAGAMGVVSVWPLPSRTTASTTSTTTAAPPPPHQNVPREDTDPHSLSNAGKNGSVTTTTTASGAGSGPQPHGGVHGGAPRRALLACGPDLWLELHDRAMGHPGNDFLNGRFRHLGQGNRAYVAFTFPGCKRKNAASEEGEGTGMTDVAIAEFKRMPRQLCYLEKSDDKHYAGMRSMPPVKRKTMRNYLRRYMHECYSSLVAAKQRAAELKDKVRQTPTTTTTTAAAGVVTASAASCHNVMELFEPLSEEDMTKAATRDPIQDDRSPPRRLLSGLAASHGIDSVTLVGLLRPIATLQIRLSRIEPSRDGNTRTMVVLVNKLLCEAGLHPCIFQWPDGAALVALSTWVEELQVGMQRWEWARQTYLALPPPCEEGHIAETPDEQKGRTKRSPLRGTDWQVAFLKLHDTPLLVDVVDSVNHGGASAGAPSTEEDAHRTLPRTAKVTSSSSTSSGVVVLPAKLSAGLTGPDMLWVPADLLTASTMDFTPPPQEAFRCPVAPPKESRQSNAYFTN